MRRGGGGMLRCGVWNTAERRRETTKDLERHHLGFLGLQPFEIPQNGQRNVWKSLDRNTLDLEKLAKKLGARLCFAAFAPAARGSLSREWRLSQNGGSLPSDRRCRRMIGTRSYIERYLARGLKSD